MTGSDIRKIRCVGAIVRDAAERLLMVRRAHDPGRGLWSIPGGRVKPGETDAEALTRELAEETGISVEVRALVGTVERPAPEGTYVIYDYACQVRGGQLRAGDDASEAAWVDAVTFDTLAASAAMVTQLADTLRQWHVLPGPTPDEP